MPAMYTDLTTRRVLIMEWVDGQRLKGQNRTAQGAQDELKMVEIGVSFLCNSSLFGIAALCLAWDEIVSGWRSSLGVSCQTHAAKPIQAAFVFALQLQHESTTACSSIGFSAFPTSS